MSAFLFANNAQATLASPITNTATTIALAAGSGVLFPSPGAGQQFAVTLIAAANPLPSAGEIVYCTSRSGDTLTVVRAQESTTAQAFLAGDFAWSLPTAGQMSSFAQSSGLATSFFQGTDNSGSGAPNACNVVTYTPANSSPTAGQVFEVVKSAYSNTGGVTLADNGGTAYPVVYKDGSALNAGDWAANSAALLYFTGSVYQFQANQANIFSLITSFPSISPARNILLGQTAHGTGTATVPAGVTWIYYQIVGAGGGGSGGNGSDTWSSGGGGSGGASQGWLAVSPGNTISWTNGQGGAGGGSNDGDAGGTGGTSSITHGSTTISATGGTGGTGGTATSAGGTPGQGSGGQINLYGANGGDGNPLNASVQGGAGASSILGGGGRTSTVAGSETNGLAPGSGGGGIWGTGGTAAYGGAGADGAIFLMY